MTKRLVQITSLFVLVILILFFWVGVEIITRTSTIRQEGESNKPAHNGSRVILFLDKELGVDDGTETSRVVQTEAMVDYKMTTLQTKQNDVSAAFSCADCTCPAAAAATPSPANPSLRNIRMVMIGDSLMRYQYLSLVYRLRHGVWFDDSTYDFHLVQESSFKSPFHSNSWGEFLHRSNRLLQPYEVCDCFRKTFHTMDEVAENRYYYDPVLNNSVVYLQAFGHHYPMRGRLKPQQVRKVTQAWRARAFKKFSKVKWQYKNWSDVIVNHIQGLDPQPRHIVMNAGIWKHDFGLWGNSTNPTSATRNLFRIMKQTKDQYEYVWRTTTYSMNRDHKHMSEDAYMCDQFPDCVNVSFTRNVRLSLYWNHGHFLEPVYRAINEFMLHQLGYLPRGYVKMNVSQEIF